MNLNELRAHAERIGVDPDGKTKAQLTREIQERQDAIVDEPAGAETGGLGAPESAVPNAILIVRPDEGPLEIQVLGNVRLAEVPTLLEVGIKTARKQIGLDS